MKKIKLYLLATLSLTVYILSMSPEFMRFFALDWNNSKRPALLNWDKYKYGDLYGICYFGDYKTPVSGTYDVLKKTHDGETDNQLWIIGDSFLEKAFGTDSGSFTTGNFRVHHFYWYMTDDQPELFQPVAGKKNILLIELNERFVCSYLAPANAAAYLNCYYSPGETIPSPKKSNALTARIVPEKIEQNLEALLFGYEIFAPLKETKAKFNYAILGRETDMVYVSPEQQRLFLAATVDPGKPNSSFIPVSDKQISSYVAEINNVREAYKAKGFDEVVFSFVPNAATLTPPGNFVYNGLIPRIQQHPALRAPVIDVYSPMMASPLRESLYWKSDTHWNADGFSTWVQQFAARMEQLSGNPSGRLVK